MTSSSFLKGLFGSCGAVSPPSCSPTPVQPFSTKALETHQFDRPMRCIIDPHQVVAMLKYQDEELIRQDQAKSSDSSDTPPAADVPTGNENEMWDVESSMVGTEFSYAARSNITTATEATPVLANRDKYASKRKSKRDQFKVLEAIDRRSRPTHLFYDDPSRKPKGQTTPVDQEQKSQPKLPKGVQLTGYGCANSLVSSFMPGEDVSRRKELGRAMHLKLKAHVGKFYWGQFMKLFPLSPTPESLELLRRPSSRSLSWSLTDSSSTVLQATYGDYVHSSSVQMLVDDSDFMDLGVTGSLGLVKRFEVSQSGERLKSPNHYKVLLNRRSGVPLAVCALKSTKGPPVVRIYTIKQRAYGQKPAATTKQLGLGWCESYPLYAWAEFTAEGDFPLPVRYSLYMSSGGAGRFEAEPSYRASHRVTGSPEILVVGKTESERDLSGCALLSLQGGHEESYLAISVARGIDPALMICMAAIVDETMENSMRQMCDANYRSRLTSSPPKTPKTPPMMSRGLPPLRKPAQF